jgi:ATP-dependent protease HslVU (ClpYQ) peptidase subunit
VGNLNLDLKQSGFISIFAGCHSDVITLFSHLDLELEQNVRH